MKRIIRFLCLLTLCVLSIPFWLYIYGASQLEYFDDPPEVCHSDYVLSEYKKWVGRIDDSDYRKFNPYSYAIQVFAYGKRQDRHLGLISDISLYSTAVNIRRLTRSRNYGYRSIVAVIYVSRNWSVDQTISVLLANQFFGNGIYGIESASDYYFGLSPGELTTDQLFTLFHIPSSPSKFELWCDMEAFKASIESRFLRHGVVYNLPPLIMRKDPEQIC